jgi:hypothetical protein
MLTPALSYATTVSETRVKRRMNIGDLWGEEVEGRPFLIRRGDAAGLDQLSILFQRDAYKLASGPHASLGEELLQRRLDRAF